jgi:hypothetical protein
MKKLIAIGLAMMTVVACSAAADPTPEPEPTGKTEEAWGRVCSVKGEGCALNPSGCCAGLRCKDVYPQFGASGWLCE